MATRLTLEDWPDLKRYAEELAYCATKRKDALQHYAKTEADKAFHELAITRALDAVDKAECELREARCMFYAKVNEMTSVSDPVEPIVEPDEPGVILRCK